LKAAAMRMMMEDSALRYVIVIITVAGGFEEVQNGGWVV
jgi:hypothetical protein